MAQSAVLSTGIFILFFPIVVWFVFNRVKEKKNRLYWYLVFVWYHLKVTASALLLFCFLSVLFFTIYLFFFFFLFLCPLPCIFKNCVVGNRQRDKKKNKRVPISNFASFPFWPYLVRPSNVVYPIHPDSTTFFLTCPCISLCLGCLLFYLISFPSFFILFYFFF